MGKNGAQQGPGDTVHGMQVSCLNSQLFQPTGSPQARAEWQQSQQALKLDVFLLLTLKGQHTSVGVQTTPCQEVRNRGANLIILTGAKKERPHCGTLYFEPQSHLHLREGSCDCPWTPACCGFLMGEGSGEGHQTLTRDLVRTLSQLSIVTLPRLCIALGR